MSTVGTLYDETVKFGFAKLLSTQAASNSASLDFIAPFVGNAYDTFIFDLFALGPTATDTAYLAMVLSADGGATWGSSGYWTEYARQGAFVPGPPIAHGSVYQGAAAQTLFALSDYQYAPAGRLSGRVRCNPGLSSEGGVKSFEWQLAHHAQTSGGNTLVIGGGGWSVTHVINGVRFFYSGTTVATGSIRCYGLKRGT